MTICHIRVPVTPDHDPSRAQESGNPMFMSLAEALETDLLRRARPRVRAGAARVARTRVRWVHSSEVLKIAPLLHGQELLLTGGDALLGLKPEPQRQYVRALAERGISALAVETAGSVHGLSAELVAEAEALQLPLIELEQVVPFVDVAEDLNRRIVARQASALQSADALSHRLAEQLASSGPALPPLLELLAGTLGVDVTVLDRGGEVLGSAGPPRAGLTPRAEGSAAVPSPGHPGDGTAAEPVETDVLIGGVPVARLVLTGGDEAGRALLAVAGERVSSILALALSHRHAPTLEQMADTALMRAVVEGRDVGRLRELARAAGCPAQEPVVLAVFGPAVTATTTRPVERSLRARAPGARVLFDGDHLYALVPLDPARSRQQRRALLQGLRQDLAGVPVSGALGPTAAGLSLAPRSLREARWSLSLGGDAGDENVGDSEEHVVERLAVSELSAGTVERLVQEVVGELLAYDRRRGTQLLETLDAWLRSGCNTAETARVLYLERQSVHHRLARIFELLGGDPRGTARMAGLSLATRLARRRLPLAAGRYEP